MKRRNKVYILLIMLVWVSTSFAQKVKINGVDAVVGNEVILKSDLEEFVFSAKQSGYKDVNPCQVMDQILAQKLLVHFAKRDTVTYSESRLDYMVDAQYKQIESQAGGEKELRAVYKKSPEEIKEQMRDLMKDQLLAQSMMEEITKKVDVSPYEIMEFYKSIPPTQIPYIGDQVEVARLVKKPVITEEHKQEIIDKLLAIKKEIEDGASFATKAILNSEDPGSANNGGLYNNVGRGQFVKPFEEVAYNLEEGEISDPVETEFGFHIIQLVKRKGELLDLRHILIKPKPNFDELQATESFMDSLRSEILNNKITWDDAVRKFSEDDETKFNQGLMFNDEAQDTRFEITKLNSDMSLAVSMLKNGDISAPTYGDFGRDDKAYTLYKVMDKIPGHTLNYKEDYNKLKNAALNNKKQEVVQEWEKNNLSDVFIKIGDEFKDCQFSLNYLKKE